jgi:hypothetical protein
VSDGPTARVPGVNARPEEKPPFVPIIDLTPIAALTTLNARRWEWWLNEEYGWLYPDLANQIVDGIVHGVTIDYEGDRSNSRFGRNPPISVEHAAKVSEVIAEDVASLKKAGPFDRQPFEFFCVSPIGAVPKKNSVKVRVIHNLSHPFRGDSVNEGIEDGSLRLSSFGHAARAVVMLGAGCWLIKLDVKAAYKLVPVRREDWCLLGFKWEGKWYYERVLPFGLRSSCRLWELYAAALRHFIARSLNLPFDRIVIHYVDDFLFVVKLKSDAQHLLARALDLCEELGVPIASEKTEGPTTCLTFLGIELDTVAMEARLPPARLLELQQLVDVWVSKSTASISEIESLHGTLQWACGVVRPGRFYLRRLIAHSSRIKRWAQSDKAQFALPRPVIEDVRWWQQFLTRWNGVGLLYDADWIASDKLELFTDACNTGYGGYYQGQWFAGRWTDEQLAAAHRRTRISMPFLELHAVVTAAGTFGHLWRGKKIIFRCDCGPVVHAVERCSSRREEMMHLLRCLSSIACDVGFDFKCIHIRGVDNEVADILSRYADCAEFRALRPNAHLDPTISICPSLPAPPDEQPTPSPKRKQSHSRRTSAHSSRRR